MKARLDHIGIAVTGLADALAFYKEALGLEVSPPHDVPSEHVRAVFVPVGESSLELLEATSPDSPIGRFVERHGPGLHHITLTVPDLDAALASLESRGVRLDRSSASPRRARVARGVRAPLLGGRRAARVEAGARGAVSVDVNHARTARAAPDGRRLLRPRRRRHVRGRPQDAVESGRGAGRPQPDPHGDAAVAGHGREPADPHRRRLRRQAGREVRRHLRVRPDASPGSRAGRRGPDRRRHRLRRRVASAFRPRRRLHAPRGGRPRRAALPARPRRRFGAASGTTRCTPTRGRARATFARTTRRSWRPGWWISSRATGKWRPA